jgi:Ca2+-transporting ATPase
MSTPLPSLPPSTPPWHTLTAEAALAALASTAGGLSGDEAAGRLLRLGPNRLTEARARGPWRMLLDQFRDFMILVLLAAAAISGFIGDVTDTLVILLIVLLNAVIGFVQEYRAERAIAALKALAAPSAQVRRSGQTLILPSADLVPGDIVLLEAGNAVPADLRLLEVVRLRVDESALTGESLPVDKLTAALTQADLPLGDQRNLAFKGTLVAAGRGMGVVIATGMSTELGRIANLLQSTTEARTPLQQRLAAFGTRLAWVVLGICTLLFAAGLLRGEEPLLMLLTAISLAVAAIPEALPAVVTVALGLGAHRLVRQQALIRKLPAVETLGSVTFICSDKTGTLTENRMRVEALHVQGDQHSRPPADAAVREPWRGLLTALALCNDARRDHSGELLGDPTETALYDCAVRAGLDPAELRAEAPRLVELPFDSERARMATLHAAPGGGAVAFVKGAPENLLPLCVAEGRLDGVAPLDSAAWLEAASRMAAEGLRVLAVAQRRLSAAPDDPLQLEQGLELLGLVGLLDPPRAEAAAAVAQCKLAGITPVMITGDHPATALAIARRLGISDAGGVLTGTELGVLAPGALRAAVAQTRVYARVAPEQKIHIVQALQARGEFVAMTGDGVNDAPALRAAGIGVAMGRGGTDVAREAAHMVLLDDNFATIVAAVREGRRIFDNIRKFIKYTMTSNSGEIWTIFLAPFLGLPIPLLPIHILWINLVTDGLPGLALSVEREERGVMRRPPRPPRESIFAHGMWQHILWVGLLMGGLSLLTQAWALHIGSAHWQSMVFTVLTLSQMGHALAIRSERDSLFLLGPASNPALLAAVLLTFGLQMATLYVPALNPIFHTAPLSAGELAMCLLLSSGVFIAVEIEKWLIRHAGLYGASAPVV